MNYRKINRFWQSATLFLAPQLIVLLIWFRPSMDAYQWLLWLHLPLLMLHEAEEYVLAPTSFKEFFNLKSPMGTKTDPDYPLDEGYVFQVNMMIAWPMVILGAILIVFVLLVPEAATQRHLEILSEIAEMLSDRELRERLKTEPDATGVHKLISDWEPLKSVA